MPWCVLNTHCFTNTVESWYLVTIFLQWIHKRLRCPIAQLWGWAMGYPLWVWSLNKVLGFSLFFLLNILLYFPAIYREFIISCSHVAMVNFLPNPQQTLHSPLQKFKSLTNKSNLNSNTFIGRKEFIACRRQIDGLVQERHNSIALNSIAKAMELRLSCTYPLRWSKTYRHIYIQHQNTFLVWQDSEIISKNIFHHFGSTFITVPLYAASCYNGSCSQYHRNGLVCEAV